AATAASSMRRWASDRAASRSARALLSASSRVRRRFCASRSIGVSARLSARPRSASARWNSTSLLSNPRAIRLQYSTGMAIDVTARRGRLQNSLRLDAGPLADALRGRAHGAERAAGGLYRHEPATWSDDPGVRRKIADRLGWMRSPQVMRDALDRLRTFAANIRRDGFTDVVLLGMGGSSLAPEVLRAILGIAEGWPRFHMLDSTDPASVLAAATPPQTTLYILASKSGTTIEPNSLAAHFRQRLLDAGVPSWASHFVAITDEGTELDRRARAEGFRDLFNN